MATRQEIKQIQQTLKNLGFDPGPIDGIVGPRTRSAAQNYVNTLSGTAAKGAYEYYNNVLGGLTSKKIIAPKEEEKKDKFILYDKEGNSYTYDVFPQAQVDAGILFEEKPTGQEEETEEETEDQVAESGDSKSLDDIIADLKSGPSMAADITSYEVDKINQELGLTGTAFGSALERAENRVNRGLYTEEEYIELAKSIDETVFFNILNGDKTAASRLGSVFNLIGTGLGITGKAISVAMEEVFGAGLNALYDVVEPDVGGAGDAFVGALLGKPGENVFSDWWIDKFGTYRYDAFTNSMVDVSTGETVASIGNAQGDQETKKNNEENITTAPGGTGGTGAVDEGPLYWGRYDTGSWATSTKPGKPEGFKWAWELDEFPDKNEDLYTSDKSIEDILGLASVEEQEIISEDKIIVYRNGESREILLSDLALYQADGWSTTKPSPETGEPETEDEEDEVGPGQLVSDTLNEFNNVPRNSILIEAGGQLFLGYEVPGAYGQLYNGNPIFMLYEVLDNDVFEAGLLTQGASPQINVSLGSLEDLNQYGIIVGGTDELTDDVEHPFIRFTENFEAGKRVNPWLNDTEINPNTGVTYQQEAIEFLAEQSLEQWTPETTQIRYEGSDWYRKSTTAQKTWLTTLLTQPQQAQQDIQDKQIEVRASMEANGIASPPDALVSWIADKAVTGMWTQVYTDQQIALLADPYKPGTRDNSMVNFIEGVGVGTLDRLSVGEKTVRDLYRRYLGPSLGNASETEIAEKAGLLRSDPDAEEQLKAYLEQQRLAMFGKYTNPTLTYNDIVQPYKNLVNQVWGQEVDETQDWFIKMVQDNDIEKAYTTLRQKGMEQGVERVQDQALNDLQRGIGQGQVAPELGANR